MLSEAIGNVLAPAVGVALSPIPIIAVVVMLGTPRAKSNGPAFALGWVSGMVVVATIVLLLTSGASDPDSSASTGVDWFQVVLGLVFFRMAVKQWRKRPQKGVEPEMPKWMESVDGFTPVKALGLGALLSGANPKNLILTMAAAASISQAGLSGGDDVIALAVFVVIASSTTVGAVLFYLVATDRAAPRLASVKEFMATHNAVIMMVILLVLGAKLVGEGLGGLGS